MNKSIIKEYLILLKDKLSGLGDRVVPSTWRGIDLVENLLNVDNLSPILRTTNLFRRVDLLENIARYCPKYLGLYLNSPSDWTFYGILIAEYHPEKLYLYEDKFNWNAIIPIIVGYHPEYFEKYKHKITDWDAVIFSLASWKGDDGSVGDFIKKYHYKIRDWDSFAEDLYYDNYSLYEYFADKGYYKNVDE